MSHTPGPLKASEFIGDAGIEIVADGQCIARAYPLLQRDANARLIAAAPEMLTVASALLAKLDTITTEEFSRGEEKTEREALRAAIRKATGG